MTSNDTSTWAALFDWDGVIVDSSRLHALSWDRLAEAGYRFRFFNEVVQLLEHQADGLSAHRFSMRQANPRGLRLCMLEEIRLHGPAGRMQVHRGGPVETGRGFVLHSADYLRDGSLSVADGIALTATIDILRSIASGAGPRKSMLALGYAGWGPGQLEREIKQNGWLNVAADEELIFGGAIDDKWRRALAKMGIDPTMLSSSAGRA